MKVGDLVRNKRPLPGYEPSIGVIVEFGKMAGSTKLWRVMWQDRDGKTSLCAEVVLEVIGDR